MRSNPSICVRRENKMDEETQWIVEEIEKESEPAGTLIACSDSDNADQDPQSTAAQQKKALNKRKRLEKKKEASKRHRQEKFSRNSMRGVEHQTPDQQADAFQKLICNISDIEKITAGDFVDLSDQESRDIKQLQTIVKRIQPKWKQLFLDNPKRSSPVLLILTYSAIRAVEIVRYILLFIALLLYLYVHVGL